MDIPVDLLIIVGGGAAAYFTNRMLDRERLNKLENDLRKWIDEKYVPRELLNSKLEGLGTKIKDMDTRVSRMHVENSGKLDHLLSIVSALSGLSSAAVKHRRMGQDDEEE